MSSQNNMVTMVEGIKDVLFYDKHMKASDIRRNLLNKRKREDYNPPSSYSDKLEIKSVFENGDLCFYIKPKNKEVDKYFFYVHGSGTGMQITHKRWEFVLELVLRTGYGAAVPIYPLAPEHSLSEALEMLMGAYKKICKDESVTRIVLLGDFSGGGLALSMALLAWKSGIRRPNKLVLLSPVMDMEFENQELLMQISDQKKNTYRYYYTPAMKEFLQKYWVKDLKGQIEYTAPVFADLTDICDDIGIFTVSEDLMNCYARQLYSKVKQLQMKAHYYEFYGVVCNYIEHLHVPECKMILKKIAQSITDAELTVSEDIKHAVWARSVLSERYPKLFSDSDSIKLASKLNIEHKAISSQYDAYDKAVLLEKIISVDKRVRNFVRRYADSIVVNVGAELDTMFSRVDNGRIKWYNVDLPERIELRRAYLESRDREQNIERSIFDYTWMDQIKRTEGQPILFVCYDVMKYFDKRRLRSFLDAIWQRFPGAEIVFDIKNSVGKKKYNSKIIRGKNKGAFIKVSVDNCTSLMYDWNIKYKILHDQALLDQEEVAHMFSPDLAKKFAHAIKRKYDKIIQLRLGSYHFLDESI